MDRQATTKGTVLGNVTDNCNEMHGRRTAVKAEGKGTALLTILFRRQAVTNGEPLCKRHEQEDHHCRVETSLQIVHCGRKKTKMQKERIRFCRYYTSEIETRGKASTLLTFRLDFWDAPIQEPNNNRRHD